MPTVEVPDFGEIEFPDSMSQDDIKGVLAKKFPPKAQPKTQDFPAIPISPYDEYRLKGGEASGPFGPANPQEVLNLPQVLNIPSHLIEASGLPQAAEDIGADLLKRTRLDPSAQPGESVIPEVPGEPALWSAARKFATPGNLLLAPLAAARVPGVIPAFEGQMVAGVPSSMQAFQNAKNEKEATEALVSAGLGLATGAHLVSNVKPSEIINKGTEPTPSVIRDQALNEPNKIESTSGVPVEQQSVPVDTGTKGQTEVGTPQRPSESQQAVPQPAQIQEITPPSAPTPGVRQQVPSDVAAKGGEAAASSPAPASVESGTPEAIRQVTEPPVRSILEPEKGSGGDLQMTIAPGVKEFIEQDLTPKLQEASKVIGETAQQTKALLSPPSMSDAAQMAAGIAREGKAELAQRDLQARLQFEEAKKAMDKLSKPESLAFTDAIEKGGKQPTPAAQKWADSLRSELDKRAARIQALGTGKLQHLIQDYFPHLWKDPTATVSWYARILGRRPLRGPASFLKQRSIPFTADGIAAGLEPVTWNPIELALLKMHEMDRYEMGQKIFNEYKDKGLLQFSRSDVPPDGYAKVDDRIANVVQYRPTTKANGQPGPPERILRGHYYAQEDAARVLNNFLSPGLERYAWYRTIRWMGNTMNLAQLGLSGYHFLFTMIDASTGKLALGLEQAARGDVLQGAGNVARGIAGIPGINQLEYFLKGSKVLKEYTKPGTVGGDYAKIVDSLLAAGGRTEMPKIFKNSSLENFMTAFRSGNYPGAVIRAPFAAIQAISHPLMQVVVPRLKLGAFTDMARYELEKLGPNATRDQIRKTMGSIWDSVDNRMGEMVYDNLFWNRTLKDTSFLAVRAVGWNLGTIRELGGGLVDSAKIIGRLQRGDPLVTRRMAYVMALPITVGTMGAMYQYMKTGKGPEELKDYFYPKTGKMLPDGTPERVDFPSYLKDIYAYSTHPIRTVTNKLHPLWSTMAQMINNKDYYGGQIRNPDDPLVKQVGEELAFVGKTFVPFSIKGAERRVGAAESPEVKAESFMGIMPIPPEIARTAAQNKIMEYGVAKMPQGAKTEGEQQRQELKRDLESQINSPQDYEKARSQLEQLRREGKLTRGQQIYERNKLNYQRGQMDAGKTKSEAQWLWRFRHLDLNEARHVYEVATPAEKKLFERDIKLKERKAEVNQ